MRTEGTMEKFLELVLKLATVSLLAIGVIVFCAVVSAFPVKWAWNATMPELFHLPEIGVVKAFCLVWLAGALVKASPNNCTKKHED